MTKSTEEMSRELHDWLKRDGECWHDFQREPQKCKKGTVLGYYDRCTQCGIYKEYGIYNPNFFSPATEDQAAINFFWLWDRMKEYDDLLLDQIEIINSKRGYYLDELIDCEILAKALYEFKESQ